MRQFVDRSPKGIHVIKHLKRNSGKRRNRKIEEEKEREKEREQKEKGRKEREER